MRMLISLSMVVGLLLFSTAHADIISVYEPSGGGLTDDCNLELVNDISWALNIVHQSQSGATGSEFRLEFNWGTGSGTILTGSSPYASPPFSWFSGQAFDYGSCLTGDFFVAQIIIVGATNVPCEAFLHVREAGGNSTVITTDCNGTQTTAIGGTLTIDGDASCPCGTVPVEQSTWGRIKSLFLVDDTGY